MGILHKNTYIAYPHLSNRLWVINVDGEKRQNASREEVNVF